MSGSGVSWAICKSAPRSRQITTQFFTGRMPFLPPNQQHQSTEGKINNNVYGHHFKNCQVAIPPQPFNLVTKVGSMMQI